MKPKMVFIDLNPFFRMFVPGPFCIMNQLYQSNPMLLHAVSDIGLMTFFKTSYMLTGDQLTGDAMIWQYLEYTDSPWLTTIPNDQDLLMAFDTFVQNFSFEADGYLESVLKQHGIDIHVEELLFENCYESSTVLMITEEIET